MHHGERRMGHVFFLGECSTVDCPFVCCPVQVEFASVFCRQSQHSRHFLLHVDPFLPHFIMAYTYNLDDVELPHLLRFHVE